VNKDYTVFGKKIDSGTLISAALALLGVVLILVVIKPQIESIGEQREQNTLKQNEIVQLQSSLAALNSVSAERVADDVKIMNEALPTNKDIITIFSTIISLTTKTGVELSGFTLQVGDIFNTTKDKAAPDQIDVSSDTGFPALNVQLTLQSTDQSQVVEFTKLLYEKLPLARVNNVTAQEGSSSLDISFYYRPQDLTILQNTNTIPGYTKESLNTLDTLRKWKDN
jgi:hypothetical protein